MAMSSSTMHLIHGYRFTMGEHNLITQTNWLKNIEIVQQIMYDVNPSDMHVCLQFTMHDVGGHILFSTIPHRTPQVAGESAKTGASPGAYGGSLCTFHPPLAPKRAIFKTYMKEETNTFLTMYELFVGLYYFRSYKHLK